MNRMTLPGKERNKKIVLIVLVIIAIFIIGYERTINFKDYKFNDENNKQSEEFIKPMESSQEFVKE